MSGVTRKIFGGPSMPKVEAPPPPPTVDEARQAAETRDQLLRRRGRRSTVLTDAMTGGTGPVGRTTLIGS